MKSLQLGILDEIKKAMDDRMADKLTKPKAVSVEVESTEEEPMETTPEVGVETEKECDPSKLSPEEMAQLKSLYEKMMG